MTTGFENLGPGPAGPQGVNPREAVSVPAILLMLVAGIGLGCSVVFFAAPPLMDALLRSPNLTGQLRDALAMQREDYAAWKGLPLFLLSGLSLFGAIQMKNLRSYGWAWAAAIINCIPCYGSCCCIGLPLGIWAIIVLIKPEVKAAFGRASP